MSDGSKLPPYLIYKGNKESPLLKKVLDTNEFVNTAEVMIDWIDQVWKKYIFSLGFQYSSLLILDYATSHLKEEVQHSLINLDVEYAFIPKGLTSIL